MRFVADARLPTLTTRSTLENGLGLRILTSNDRQLIGNQSIQAQEDPDSAEGQAKQKTDQQRRRMSPVQRVQLDQQTDDHDDADNPYSTSEPGRLWLHSSFPSG